MSSEIRAWTRKFIPMILLVITGVPVVFKYFFKISEVNTYVSELQTWSIILFNFTLLVAIFSYGSVHINKIQKRQPQWYWSVYGIAIVILYTIFGLYLGANTKAYYNVYYNTLVAAATAGNSMLLFYLVSAAYRSYRARNLQAGVLLVAAAIIMMGNAPFGDLILPGISNLSNWLFENPIAAVQRTIAITAATGGTIQILRIWLGHEKGGVPRE